MSDEEQPLSPLSDPENVQFEVVDDEGDEEPGMTEEEADDFLTEAIDPLDDDEAGA